MRSMAALAERTISSDLTVRGTRASLPAVFNPVGASVGAFSSRIRCVCLASQGEDIRPAKGKAGWHGSSSYREIVNRTCTTIL